MRRPPDAFTHRETCDRAAGAGVSIRKAAFSADPADVISG